MTATLPIAVTVESPDPMSDAELVDRFVTVRDPAAFTELVHRYSALVLGVCRRVLRDPCDVEDVFQATFLVLVRDAARIRRQQSLASWLYGVAYRIALRVARQKQRRRETMFAEDDGHVPDPLTAVADRYDQQLVDVELNALPDRYRQPMVLRYLCGKSSQEIADDLKLTVGAVDGLLKRGKDELRTRLMRRGVTLGVALAAVQGTREVLQSLDCVTLIDQTVQAGLAWQNGLDLPTDIFSNRALELSGKELVAMTTMTKSGVAAGLALSALVLGWGTLTLVDDVGTGRAEAGVISSVRTTVAAATAAEVAAIGQDPAATEESQAESIRVAQAAPIEPVVPAAPQATSGAAAGALQPTSTFGGAVAGRPTGPPPKPWDTKTLNERARRLDTALREQTEISFTDNPLSEALSYLSDLHHVEITVDKRALQDEGVSEDSQVSLKTSGVSLKSGLRLFLEPLGLDYVIQNETLMITSQSKAAEMFETRVYTVRRLKGMTPAELDEIIRATIEPESWSSIKQAVETTTKAGEALSRTPGAAEAGGGMGGGGPSNMEGNIRHTGNTLIIRQTQRVHDEIVDLLNQLEKSTEQQEPVTTNAAPKSVRVSY